MFARARQAGEPHRPADRGEDQERSCWHMPGCPQDCYCIKRWHPGDATRGDCCKTVLVANRGVGGGGGGGGGKPWARRRVFSMTQVDGFGAAVGDAAGVELGQDLLAPAAQGPAESGDLGDRAGGEGGDDLLGDRAGRRRASAWYIERSCW